MISTLAPEEAVHVEENPYSYEAIKSEVKTLESFRQLFEVNEAVLKPEYIGPLRQAPHEVVQIMSEQLQSAETFIETSKSPAIRNMYERQFEEGVNALTFFNRFCEDLNGVESYDVAVQEDELGGLIINMSPKEDIPWGELGGQPVKAVQIILRNGSKVNPESTAYTPMQFNVRFLGDDSKEIDSWRLDMHNTKTREIQVDAKVGGDSLFAHHKRVESLNNSQNPEKSFQAMQAAFLLNFGRLYLLGKDEKGRTVGNARANYESDEHIALVRSEYSAAIKFLKKES